MAHILLVEDDLELGEQIRLDLEERGHEVRLAYGAPDGVSYIDNEEVLDLVICDIFLTTAMPASAAESLQVFNAIRRRRNRENVELPLIAMSGGIYGSQLKQEVVDNAMSWGAVASIAKPFFPDELSDLIDSALGTSTG